ncbi:hypothetical protein [Ruegeria sp. Ofav3-42]|uniref:hypothetical protein n=1 Tax=Ruegeria sp. Ofav3-42 TaxID=2917759 RepID=UPI001EF570EF|nr:hypothetical protein [Ruegeria sp. Ofav3-42]MCG7519289.1 hypothetical protein [Ruegeria sp. Ofav3-42]
MATNILGRFAEAYGQGAAKSNPPLGRIGKALMRHCNGQVLGSNRVFTWQRPQVKQKRVPLLRNPFELVQDGRQII